LVAINPYQNLPLYTDAIISQYRSKRRDENPPHIFAVAERAWVNMGQERENQSILITSAPLLLLVIHTINRLSTEENLVPGKLKAQRKLYNTYLP